MTSLLAIVATSMLLRNSNCHAEQGGSIQDLFSKEEAEFFSDNHLKLR